MTETVTEFEKLLQMEQIPNSLGATITCVCTGDEGVAGVTPDGQVAVYYGADDGSDDKTISPDEFNRAFRVTGPELDT